MGHSEQWERIRLGLASLGEGHDGLTAATLSWWRHKGSDLDEASHPGLVPLLAIHLIRYFRQEETALKQLQSPLLDVQRREHDHLARQLRDLLADQEGGTVASPRIQAFLDSWLTHQEATMAGAKAALRASPLSKTGQPALSQLRPHDL